MEKKTTRITISINEDVKAYYQLKAEEMGVPYSTYISVVLSERAIKEMKEDESLEVLRFLVERSDADFSLNDIKDMKNELERINEKDGYL